MKIINYITIILASHLFTYENLACQNINFDIGYSNFRGGIGYLKDKVLDKELFYFSNINNEKSISFYSLDGILIKKVDLSKGLNQLVNINKIIPIDLEKFILFGDGEIVIFLDIINDTFKKINLNFSLSELFKGNKYFFHQLSAGFDDKNRLKLYLAPIWISSAECSTDSISSLMKNNPIRYFQLISSKERVVPVCYEIDILNLKNSKAIFQEYNKKTILDSEVLISIIKPKVFLANNKIFINSIYNSRILIYDIKTAKIDSIKFDFTKFKKVPIKFSEFDKGKTFQQLFKEEVSLPVSQKPNVLNILFNKTNNQYYVFTMLDNTNICMYKFNENFHFLNSTEKSITNFKPPIWLTDSFMLSNPTKRNQINKYVLEKHYYTD
jgi:hypothetical protein